MSENAPEPSKPQKGVIRRSGTPTNSPNVARLPTIRTPRDLTLGGKQKRTFTPNIPVRREKKEESTLSASSSKKSERKPRDGARGRGGRGKNRQGEFIQTHSAFELGPAERPGPKPGTTYEGGGGVGGGGWGGQGGKGGARGSGGRGAGGSGASYGGSIKREMGMESESKRFIDNLLNDEFIADDDLDADDPSLVPIRLPFCDSIKVEVKGKKETDLDSSSIKKVKAETGENMETSQPPSPSSMVSGNSSSCNWATTCSELFKQNSKADTGEFLFIHMPDVLPGEPKTDEDGRKQTNNQDNADAIAERLGLTSLSDFSEGLIGKIQVRKSGRTQLILGNMALDISMGTPPSFLQDVVSVSVDPVLKGGDMAVLGHVGHKLVCTPDFEHLLDTT